MNIGLKIRKIRDLKGFSQEYMAEKLNISQAAYSKLEKNQNMNFNKLEEVAKILELDSMDVLNFEDSHVFNNHDQQGGNTCSVLIQSFSENERVQFNERIKHLENEILFLRNQLESVLNK
jgi:transcriptional regulator with XRE-family HTH domain|tara:strand:+ start:235 stop:594 length:360 start_codon:yes stop_codon:yes gene_type:complete